MRSGGASSSALSRSAASSPNRLLRCVHPQGTSFSTMCGGGGRRRMGKRSRGGRFLHDGDRRIDRPWWTRSSYGRHRATPPAITHTTINLYTIRRDYIVKTRIYYDYYYFYGQFLLRRIDKLSHPIVAGFDGRTADAEHRQQ